ncbi:cytochrome P450 [Mycena belliarum]|uniref:Cytochrome P450 n=1 Tax=Mycena belliarum TaxID=1033014 RepID=A0AAD6U5E5_9AGAR|nr:cytochrome P450 [Mycena belliae]
MSYTTAGLALVSILAMCLAVCRRSTIWHIPGPPSPSWLFGNMLQLLLSPQYGDYEFEWLKIYGSVYRIKGCFGQDRLMVADPAGLQYLINSPHFVQGPVLENVVNLLYGEKSVLGIKAGAAHRRVKAALNVGFTAGAVRGYQPVFERVARLITEQLENAPVGPTDICPLLSLATLGAVSEAAAGYSLEDLGDQFVQNNTRVVALASGGSAIQVLSDAVGSYFPMWLMSSMIHLPTTAFKTLRDATVRANELGAQIVREKTEAARQELEMDNDVFSLLLQDKSEKGLSDKEIIAQTAILLLAGQDTTANTLAFALLELAKHQDLQEKLRAEIHTTLGAAGAPVLYDSLPLLNAFIKEALRLYPTEPLSDRIAVQDAVIPLTNYITTASGERITAMLVRKGQLVTEAIASYHRLESQWGTDAEDFRPSRWIDGSVNKGEAIGPWSRKNLLSLSFLGGPRTCLGWRFAVLEMQVILAELVAKFSFELPQGESVQTRVITTLLPVDSEGKKAAPLHITRIL